MESFGKLWTWAGQSFIPLAISWAVFARGGIDGPTPSIGTLVSRGYWGLLLTLVAASVLIWTEAFYARAAKRAGSPTLIPPNTTFESADDRNLIISWGTMVVFSIAIVAALTVFSVRYADSRICAWEDASSLPGGFIGSRLAAYERGCARQPCFAVGPRIDSTGKPFSGVNEYILYFTDGVLFLMAASFIAGCLYTILFAIGIDLKRERKN